MSNKGLSGCLKGGCIGCLAIVVLAVILVFVFGSLSMTVDTEPRPEQQELARELPALPQRATLAADAPHLPDILPLPTGAQPDSARGRLVLDLEMGEFILKPGPADEPIRVDADYDANAFRLAEELTTSENGAWTYEVKFTGRGGLLGLLMRGGTQARNRVEITIPRGRPLEIVGSISKGESEIDLGSLWLLRSDLELGMGDHFVEFQEPLPFPMEDFRIDASMGSLEVRHLGNASPSRVDIEQSMGELFLDLEGTWHRDAEIEVGFSMGECKLKLPEDARIDIKRASVSMGEKRLSNLDNDHLPEDAPTLQIDVHGSMGEVTLKR